MLDATALIAAAALFAMVMFFIVFVRKRRMPKNLNVEYFQSEWKTLQKMCGNKSTWPLAIIDADKLLDEALRKRKVKGKTMGERLVTVQHSLSDNDSVWFAHKLRNKLVHEQYSNLKETDVKDALVGFRQALKDLGALKK